MSYVAIAVAVVGAVAGGVGQYMSAQAQEDSAKFNQAVAKQNAELSQQQGIAAAQVQDRQARQKVGTMIANAGASGVDATSGSALDLLSDSARTARLDKLTTLWNAKAQAAGYANTATLDGMQADAASTAGTLALVNTGISAASAGTSTYNKMR